MADWPPEGGCYVLDIGTNTATSGATSVTGGAANTKGAWAQLVASTTFSASGIVIEANQSSQQSLLFDIGIGASSSEVACISNVLLASNATNPNSIQPTWWPIQIPAGSRISARCQDNIGSGAITMCAHLVGGAFDLPTQRCIVTTYGALTASSRGTLVDPTATPNTKGSWTQLTASTTYAIHGLMIGAGIKDTSAAVTFSTLADVGVGAGGSEVVLIPNYRVVINNTDELYPSFSPIYPVNIPAGSRLAMRSQSGSSSATQATRSVDFVLYAFS